MPDDNTFVTLGLSAALVEVVAELGFTAPTPVQTQSIPLMLDGCDVMGQSRTGSGKTVAFALPILQKLDLPQRVIHALVLCPTRELAAQVAREFRKLGRRHAGLAVLELAGGQPVKVQASALERGAHIAVGTPGRVLDHLRRETLDLRALKVLVLDEADRMLDMGFADDMTQILQAAPQQRQTVLFSATFPTAVESISKAWQRQPVRITVGEAVEKPPEIRQRAVVVVNQDAKPNALLGVLAQEQPGSALVFCNQKATVTQVFQLLVDAKQSAGQLHGDLEQNERDKVLARFRNQSVCVLVATDVAARGLDVEDVDLVVNYDLPYQTEIYVHRIGRTARAGKTGTAVSLATSRDRPRLDEFSAFTGTPLTAENAAAAPVALEPRPARMETLFISGGRKDKMRPGDILGAITGEAGGMNASDVGKIEIHDRFSYVAVTRNMAQLAVQRLKEGKIKGRRYMVGIAQ